MRDLRQATIEEASFGIGSRLLDGVPIGDGCLVTATGPTQQVGAHCR